jgi:hypothetical protein
MIGKAMGYAYRVIDDIDFGVFYQFYGSFSL